MKERAGIEVKNLSGLATYYSFLPKALPPEPPLVLDAEGLSLLLEANKKLARLNAKAEALPDESMFLSMYVRKEALLSSQIEGTQASLDDIFDPKIDQNINLDVAEVINYIKAMEYAIERQKELPICNRLIKETQEVLIAGLRGQDKNPGEYRKSQNWIGSSGSTLRTARFIPPNVIDMENSMSELEKYINSGDSLDTLIRAGLIHYQFETIHPFLDGNGRVGRMLIALFLMDQGILNKPVLYPSYFLKKNRIEYYDRLSEVRLKGNYEQWIKFFLRVIDEAADDALLTLEKLLALQKMNLEIIKKMGRAQESILKVFYYIETKPNVDITQVAQALSLAYNTAANAISRLEQAKILIQISSGKRNKIFSYEAYLNILREGT